MSEGNAIERAKGALPVTVDSLVAQLAELGVAEGSILIVHSSLSALGWVCGGPVAVNQALQRAVGESGTIVMPAQSSGLSDPSDWMNPPVPEDWWPIIRETMPAYDAAITPTRCMGAVVECFRSYPDTIRSGHPLVSFVARGPRAEEITRDQLLEDGFGERSPLARLYDLGASILLLGVGHQFNTSMHLGERRAFGDAPPTLQAGAPMLVDGERRWVVYDEPDHDDSDFEELGEAFGAETGLVKSAAVGAGTALLMPQRELVDFAEAWVRERRAQ